MNDRPAPGVPDRPDATDDALRRQLRALQPSAAEVDALCARAFMQWSEQHGRAATAPTGIGGSALSATLGLRTSRRRLWAGFTTGLVTCAVIATVLWVQRPDPALEELLQADVLSQMAIDEM